MSTQSIPRVVENMSEGAVVASLWTGVLGIPLTPKIEALVIPQGMDEVCRVSHAVRIWNDGSTMARYLLVAGDNWTATGPGRPSPKEGPEITMESLKKPPYNLSRLVGVHIHGYDDNTITQVNWVMEKMQELGISSFGLCVSSYHLVRWYLTFLKAMLKAGELYAVIPYSTPESLDKVIPHSEATPWQSIPGEFERIIAYQKKGDVATLLELQEYTNWLWKQSCLWIDE